MIVSVVVASHNDAGHVAACLDSIAEQAGGPLELSWQDDGSTDGTADHVAELLTKPHFATRFVRTELHASHSRRGLVHALDAAARRAQGGMLCFLRAADRFAPGRIAACLAVPDARAQCIAFSLAAPEGSVPFEWYAARLGALSPALLRGPPGGSANLVVSPALFTQLGGLGTATPGEPPDRAIWRFLLLASLHREPNLLGMPSYLQDVPSPPIAGRLSVLREVFAALARQMPRNPLFPCPRRHPAAFWAIVAEAGCAEIAERAFFPYARDSRMLGPSARDSRTLGPSTAWS